MVRLMAMVVVALAVAGPCAAQPAGATRTAMPMPPGAGMVDEAPVMAAMQEMSRAMAAVPMTGDVDRDFMAMMIPHHRGAIAMAQFELAHGREPAARAMARRVVAAQEREIVEMRAWLARHPPAK